jgi:ubiquinone/menaquinone biosynthesis C-methylase UbiE
MYEPEHIASFYDAYGPVEWRRLEQTAYGRLAAVIHGDFIDRAIKPGDRVLDIGSGPGRFSIVAARLGGRVTVADISAGQLDLAREAIGEAGQLESVNAFVQADVVNLSNFATESFDLTICFGGALSYAGEQRALAAAELVRVTRPGGTILVSVMSRYGAMANNTRRALLPFLMEYRESHLWPAIRTGDLPPFPSSSVPGKFHPPMHLYSASELTDLLPGCAALEIAGSNVSLTEGANDDALSNPEIWPTIVDVERALNLQPGLVDSGSHIIMAARKGEHPQANPA